MKMGAAEKETIGIYKINNTEKETIEEGVFLDINEHRVTSSFPRYQKL